MQQHFEIAGTGSSLPSRKVDASEIDRIGQLKAGWTAKHVGASNRYYCESPESLQTMAVDAISNAMQAAEVQWSDIDLIIDASTSQYRPIPGNAVHVQAAFGEAASGIACMDVHSTCLGFILAMNTANALFAQHKYRHVIIVCSERCSLSANWSEPDSAALLGDGAAGVVLRNSIAKSPITFAHQTFAEHLETCIVRGGAHVHPPDLYTADTDSLYRFHMDGPAIMRVAGKRLPPMFEQLIVESGVAKGKLTIVPHQASPKALKIMRRLLGVSKPRFLDEVASIGNIAAAGIPLVLDRAARAETIVRGDKVMLLGTSAGYSQAGLILKF